MILNNKKWTKSRDVVQLPSNFNYNEVNFGRICKSTEPNAIKTEFCWHGSPPIKYRVENEQPDKTLHETEDWYSVYALPIQAKKNPVLYIVVDDKGIGYMKRGDCVYICRKYSI